MILAWRQTHGAMEPNEESRNKTIHLQLTNFQPKSQEHTLGKGQSPRQLGTHMHKNDNKRLYTSV